MIIKKKKKMVVGSLDYFLQPSKVTPSLEKQPWKSQLWKSISPVPGRISRQTQLQENPRSLKNQQKKRFHVPNVNALDQDVKNWNWTWIGSTGPNPGPSGILRVQKNTRQHYAMFLKKLLLFFKNFPSMFAFKWYRCTNACYKHATYTNHSIFYKVSKKFSFS